MTTIKAAPLTYTSKDIPWANAGRGEAVFDGSFIPDEGPNGGVVVIDYFLVTARLNLTVTVANALGEDLYRAVRFATLSQVDGEKRLDQVKGDSLRILSYLALGPEGTKEHQDITFGGGAGDVVVTVAIPLAKPYAHEADDYSLPAYMFRELRLGMAQTADMSQGSSVCTVNSGDYTVTAVCHEEMGAVLHAVDCVSELEFDTPASGTMPVNGRPHDLVLFVRGANGGASLANLQDVFIPTMNMYNAPQLKASLQHQYEVLRGAAPNLFSTKGNPVRTDPFVASASGTLRALAALFTAGHKAWERPEVKNLQVKTGLGGVLALTMLLRATKRKSRTLRDLLMQTHGANASQIKTSGKSKREHSAWTPEQAAYLPEKFFRVEGGKRVPLRLFSGRRP